MSWAQLTSVAARSAAVLLALVGDRMSRFAQLYMPSRAQRRAMVRASLARAPRFLRRAARRAARAAAAARRGEVETRTAVVVVGFVVEDDGGVARIARAMGAWRRRTWERAWRRAPVRRVV